MRPSALPTIEAQVTTTQPTTPSEDDSRAMSVRVYPAGTTEPACAPASLVDDNANGDSKLGASVARAQDPDSPVVAVGAPALDIQGVNDVGGVLLYEIEDIDNPSKLVQRETLWPHPNTGLPSFAREAWSRTGPTIGVSTWSWHA